MTTPDDRQDPGRRLLVYEFSRVFVLVRCYGSVRPRFLVHVSFTATTKSPPRLKIANDQPSITIFSAPQRTYERVVATFRLSACVASFSKTLFFHRRRRLAVSDKVANPEPDEIGHGDHVPPVRRPVRGQRAAPLETAVVRVVFTTPVYRHLPRPCTWFGDGLWCGRNGRAAWNLPPGFYAFLRSAKVVFPLA